MAAFGAGPAGSGGAPALLRVTLVGTAVQLPWRTPSPGSACPVSAWRRLAMAVQCAAVAVLLRRARRQEETGVSFARAV
ncbi:hypothetical protein [Streptomyces flaveolus]|uniref:hypothetical protein n=1 Tax=Streptomyces flaveolus TaxID=67297 RepID=UPI003F54D809